MSNDEQKYEDFISTVSHELRTPLTSIRGFSQTILASWEKLDDDSKKKFIKIIEEQSNRLIHLVENMLSVTKLQSGKNAFCYQETEIKPLIEQVVSIVKNQYQTQKFNITIVQNCPKLFIDKDKFQQVLTNLIENSAKYSPQDSFSDITVKVMHDKALIIVQNLGLKINKEDYDTIFTKFARIDNPLTRKVQGSGLGLYITKNIVEKMNGKIYVESNPTELSKDYDLIKFTVEIPLKNIEEQARFKCNQ